MKIRLSELKKIIKEVAISEAEDSQDTNAPKLGQAAQRASDKTLKSAGSSIEGMKNIDDLHGYLMSILKNFKPDDKNRKALIMKALSQVVKDLRSE